MDIEELFANDLSQQLMRAVEPLVPGLHYVVFVVHPSGGLLQLSNVDPEGQKHYLRASLERMEITEPEIVQKQNKGHH
jgi:hypothetical protein